MLPIPCTSIRERARRLLEGVNVRESTCGCRPATAWMLLRNDADQGQDIAWLSWDSRRFDINCHRTRYGVARASILSL